MSLGVLKTISPIERNSVADQRTKKILDCVRTGNLAKPRVDYKFSEWSNRVEAEAPISPSLDAADLPRPRVLIDASEKATIGRLGNVYRSTLNAMGGPPEAGE